MDKMERALAKKYKALRRVLTERQRRVWAGTEAVALGRGGIARVQRATGMSRATVVRGIRDIESPPRLEPERSRRPGGGRKKLTALDTTLLEDLDALVEPMARGHPETRLRWTIKSTRTLARELRRRGHRVSHTIVAEILHDLDYSLQANRKTIEGRQHPDRDGQFRYIHRSVIAQQKRGQPAISVDTKKKELVGEFKNTGRTWQRKKNPTKVRVHDFMDKEKGKVAPYGVYDLKRNTGWVSVGISHDTAAFAVATIERWWKRLGRAAYPKARSLLITADSGGSNGPRTRLWKWELQGLADRTGLRIRIRHFPPGTSKWNKIEHRLFAYITNNWRGQPLATLSTIVNLIASTRTTKGLTVHAVVDRRKYPKGVKVSDEQMAQIRIRRDSFHGDWNYTIFPRGEQVND